MGLLQNITKFVTVACRKNEDIEKKTIRFQVCDSHGAKVTQSLRVILHN